MRFQWKGQTYGLSFQRTRKEAPDHVPDIEAKTGAVIPVTRMVTTVFLHRQVGPKEWEEINHANASRNHKDDETRDKGRLRALAHMAPFIHEELRPLIFEAYRTRPRPISKQPEAVAENP